MKIPNDRGPLNMLKYKEAVRNRPEALAGLGGLVLGSSGCKQNGGLDLEVNLLASQSRPFADALVPVHYGLLQRRDRRRRLRTQIPHASAAPRRTAAFSSRNAETRAVTAAFDPDPRRPRAKAAALRTCGSMSCKASVRAAPAAPAPRPIILSETAACSRTAAFAAFSRSICCWTACP